MNPSSFYESEFTLSLEGGKVNGKYQAKTALSS